jgi:hypothetical protein
VRIFKSFGLRGLVVAVIAALALAAVPGPDPATVNGDPVAEQSRALIFGKPDEFREALAALTARDKLDGAPAMILALRYRRPATAEISAALEALTGHSASGWFDWMVWQERHPEVTPHASYADLKLDIFRLIDPAFVRFFPDGRTLERMRIRLEEITWGGVPVDGIPSLDNPKLIAVDEATYLLEDDLVFGVEINGDARAYPLRIMGWHEMFNEVIGGVPVALAYCTLCGSGILFETQVEGRDRPLIFGSSGLLYRSNKLMFDRETGSLWNQFTGRPVAGPLVDSGIELKIRPVAITSWASWRKRHPESRVLSLDTGYHRDYGPGVVYRGYFASPDLMFPTSVDESRFRQKDYVFGIRDGAAAKAWPIEAFAGGAVINDHVGQRRIVLVGDAATLTVRAYERGGRRFEATGDATRLRSDDGDWRISEEALTGPDGARLARVPGHIAYWFAWNGYLGAESEIYNAE